MPTQQSNRVRAWKMAMGCCLVCGSPMELPGMRLDDASGPSRDTPISGLDDDSVPIIENPVRTCMFTHHMMPKMEECHIIDSYTHLPPESAMRARLSDTPDVAVMLSGSRPRVRIPALRVERRAAPRKKRQKNDAAPDDKEEKALEGDVQGSSDEPDDETDEDEQDDENDVDYEPTRQSKSLIVSSNADPYSKDAIEQLRKLGWKCTEYPTGKNNVTICPPDRILRTKYNNSKTNPSQLLVQWEEWPPYEPYATWVANGKQYTNILEEYNANRNPDIEKPGEPRRHYKKRAAESDPPTAGTAQTTQTGKSDNRNARDKPQANSKVAEKNDGMVEATAFEADLFTPDVYGSNQYAVAREACLRVGAAWVIAGCAPCNAAMNRTRYHAHTVFRMLGHSNRPAAPSMERRSDADRQALPTGQRAANELNKLLQQVTIYFCSDPQTGKWFTRSDDNIKETTFLYRIAANLVLWGEERNFRHLAIAILYASLYTRHRLQSPTTFEVWHQYYFNELYQRAFTPATFFGMRHQEVAATYSLKEASDATKWTEQLQAVMDAFVVSARAPDPPLPDAISIDEFEKDLNACVHDEQSLFVYAVNRWYGVESGLDHILDKLYYSTDNDPSAWLLSRRVAYFRAAMIPILSQITARKLKQRKRSQWRRSGRFYIDEDAQPI